ncbi:MAG: DUF5780 domain-containing protein, partial [Lachnospiraceae bacterium]|nr:DUF5780 domain-containing protein [Lachnospiraceae bacterium]
MINIFITILNMSAAATIALVAVMIVRQLLSKAPKIFSYVLWSVVFIRLICPVNFESPASLMPANTDIIPRMIGAYMGAPVSLSGSPYIGENVWSENEPLNWLVGQSITGSEQEPMPESKPESIPMPEPVSESNPATGAGTGPLILSVATYGWLLGIVIMLAYAVIGYIGLKRRVYDATIVSGNVYRTDKIATAFVLGLVRPKIYITSTANGTQLENILRHEQIHIKRRDYLIKPVAFMILAVHWFNPIVWLGYYLLSKDMEMSCDEAVLRSSLDDLRCDYSLSLLKLYTHRSTLISPLAFGEGSYNNMKARIKNVLKFKKTPRWAIIVCLLVVAVFIAGFTTTRPRELIAGEDRSITGSDTIGVRNEGENDQPPVSDSEQENEISAPILSQVPLTIESSWVDFDDSDYKWPMHASYVTNTSDQEIINYEQVFAAYDREGNPLLLYWDALGISQNGEVGSVGPGDGYGIITGISPVSPKSYLHVSDWDYLEEMMDLYQATYQQLQDDIDQLEEMEMNTELPKEQQEEFQEVAQNLLELKDETMKQYEETKFEPGETSISSYDNLFD